MINKFKPGRNFGYLVLSAAVLQACGGGSSDLVQEPALGAAQEVPYSTVDSANANSPIVAESILTGYATSIPSPTLVPAVTNEEAASEGSIEPVEAAATTSVPVSNTLEQTEPEPEPEPTALPVEAAVAEAPKPPAENEAEATVDTVAENTEVNVTNTAAATPETAPTLAFANALPSSIQCLEFPQNDIGFGNVDNEDWRAWVAPTRHRYSGATEHLSISQSPEGLPTLRQQLVPNSKGSQTVAAGAYLTSADTYRLTQSVFLEPGFDWGGRNEGGKLGFGFGGGSAPSGGLLQTDGFTVRFMWRGNKDGTAHMVIYSYAADRNQSLPYGDDHPLEGFDVPIGEWFDLAMEITVNSDISKSDGSLKAWANGELALQMDNIQWQSSGDKPAVQGLIYTTFYGGADSSWSPDQTTYIRFADVCWSPVLDEFEPLLPELGSAVNAEQFRNTKEAEGTIFSDFTEAEQPLADFAEFADSPRAAIIKALSDIDLMLPAENELIDWHFYNSLDRLNESLVVADWSTNYAVNTDSTTITHIYEGVRDAQAASLVEDAPAYVRSQISEISTSLALAAADLAEEQIDITSKAIKESGCQTQSDSPECLQIGFLMQQADAELISAIEQLQSAPLSSIEHAEQARKNAVAAVAMLSGIAAK